MVIALNEEPATPSAFANTTKMALVDSGLVNTGLELSEGSRGHCTLGLAQ